MFDVYDDCAGAAGGLVANSHNGNAEYGNAPALTGGVWLLAAPAGTMITHATVWRHAIKYRVAEGEAGNIWVTGGQQENGNIIGGSAGEDCTPAAGTGGSCEYGADGINASSQKDYDLAAVAISWGSTCKLVPDGCGRFYGVSTSNMKLSGARVTLTDNSAPALTVGATSGWRRPGTEVAYDASDNVGIRTARVATTGREQRQPPVRLHARRPLLEREGRLAHDPRRDHATAATRCASPPRTRPATRRASCAR